MLRAFVPRTRAQQFAMLIIGLVALWVILHVVFHSNVPGDPIGIAHRGAAGLAPENTLAAVSAGLDQQVEMIEIDIRRTADGELVVMHDESVSRTTDGTGQVGELTAAAIAGLDAGSSFSAEFAGEPVPTLRDVLELMQDSPATLMIEVKDPGNYPGIADDLAALLAEFDVQEDVVVISFDHQWLARFREISPATPTGALSIITARLAPDAHYIAVHWANVLLDPTLIWRVHRAGQRVTVWTVDNPLLMRMLAGLGVDGITTNRPNVWNDVR